MKRLILLLLILANFHSYSQESTRKSTTPVNNRFQIGISLSPDLCYRTLSNDDGDPTNDILINLRNDSEIVKPGITAGVNVCYNFTKYLSLETGIQYSGKGYQTKKQQLTFGQSDPTLPESSRFIYNFQYLDIPLKVNFTYGEKKVRFFGSAGVTTNLFLSDRQRNILYYADLTEKETSHANLDFNRVNLSPMMSIGISCQINSRMNLRVEPTFRYGLFSLTNTPVGVHLYSGGLNLGYYIGL